MASTIDITDNVTPILQGLVPALRRQIAPAIGAAVVLLFQDHFGALPDNRNNWPSTGFWAQCARSTNYNVLAGQVDINVNKQGFRQRLQGGEITAEGDGWLTIPAQARAYGKRAREFSNLRLAFSRKGGALRPWGLITDEFKSGDRTDGVMFWLTKSVTQQPNPAVLPTDAQITETITKTVDGIIERSKQRGGVA
jgi:hypothetical protein